MRARYQTRAYCLLLLLLPAAGQDPSAEHALQLEQDVAVLKARVATALASEQRLAATNAELRREVDGWVDVGKKVLKREAHIVDTIKQGDNGSPADQSVLRATVLAGLSSPAEPEQKTSMLATHAEEHPPSLASWNFIVMIFTVLAVVAFCWLRAPVQLSAILSRSKVLLLNELQLEGANEGFGEGYLLMQSSSGLRTRTRVAQQKEGSSVLRFDEVLTLAVQKRDGPCTFTVFRRGEHQAASRLGMVSLQASELLDCIGRGSEAPCQYFRFNVQAEAGSQEKELRVAMRIREQKVGFFSRPKSVAHVV